MPSKRENNKRRRQPFERVAGGRGARRPCRTPEALRENWLAAAWLDVPPGSPTGEKDALGCAEQGLVSRVDVEPGRIIAKVRNEGEKNVFTTSLSVPMFTDDQWERVFGALCEQAIFAARLLEGSLPEAAGHALREAGVSLVPPELTARCTCRERGKPWCTHARCAVFLIADRLCDEPLLLFTLRGLERERFLERLRERRALVGEGRGRLGVYAPRIMHVSELPPTTLEERADRYWEMDPALAELDLPVTGPEVPHALLRRLGASPFPRGRFPLVGLLATCYEMVSEATEEKG